MNLGSPAPSGSGIGYHNISRWANLQGGAVSSGKGAAGGKQKERWGGNAVRTRVLTEHDWWECKRVPTAGHISKMGILSDPANPFWYFLPQEDECARADTGACICQD